MRKRNRRSKSKRQLSTAALTQEFLQQLDQALQDERWRAFIRDRLSQTELPVIQF